MGDKAKIEDAFARLEQAIKSVERAIGKRQDKTLSVQALQSDLKRISKERSDLALSLEEAKTRSDKLEGANMEVSRRLGAAMESVRAVLDQHGG